MAQTTHQEDQSLFVCNQQTQTMNRAASSICYYPENVKRGILLHPTKYDVLCGRGRPYQEHSGNLRLHKIVNSYKAKYSNSTRSEKPVIAEDIVKQIKNRKNNTAGRFLRRCKLSSCWFEVSDDVAREKVSHALRGKRQRNISDSEDSDTEESASASQPSEPRKEKRRRLCLMPHPVSGVDAPVASVATIHEQTSASLASQSQIVEHYATLLALASFAPSSRFTLPAGTLGSLTNSALLSQPSLNCLTEGPHILNEMENNSAALALYLAGRGLVL